MARKTSLEEEATLVADLEASMAASDLQALSRHVATCLRLGIANKHPDVMAKAKAKAAELGAQQQVKKTLGRGCAFDVIVWASTLALRLQPIVTWAFS